MQTEVVDLHAITDVSLASVAEPTHSVGRSLGAEASYDSEHVQHGFVEPVGLDPAGSNDTESVAATNGYPTAACDA
ncbi:hypothetical protein E2C01_049286 [Portunus trituberculatus]|uniref:Uncharacterized protein n=1 Tax=Portunus trituberculatus TaxID=210409 RepID=A0A5B7GDJ2_PORTR|nr:hypothetical protein [Portunus trituberculatus]